MLKTPSSIPGGLFFAKRSKTCVINIIESTFSTTVQIWVAPALESNG